MNDTIDLTKANMNVQAANNFETGTQYGLFYDWFCKDSSLPSRSKRLAARVRSVMKANMSGGLASGKFDPATCYVFFKNNCPMSGGTYDDFRICDLETGDVQYTVTPSYRGNAEVWGKDNEFDGPIVSGTWEQVLEFFGKQPKVVPAPVVPAKPKVDPDADIKADNINMLNVIHVLRAAASLKIADNDNVSKILFDTAEHHVKMAKQYMSGWAPFSANTQLKVAVRIFRMLTD